MNTHLARLRYVVTTLAIFGACLVLNRAGYSAESTDTGDDPGVEVQTRGPVHEAFAGVVTFNPEPGVVVPKAPPEAIEELPPTEKLEGDNVAWIPGYWAWDDERNDFLWVSGVWRALPPGRQWMPGYWAKIDQGYRWTSGYWADSKAVETTYLPPPPATIQAGPNIVAPSPDYNWVPGCWVWYGGRYAWRPGYWLAGRPDWDWCPPYYSWTPRGYVFVDGYWDYCVPRRGVLFAPVFFGPGVYVRTGFYYSPRIVIDLDLFPVHLFIRPAYHHCYFGDYYAPSYFHAGFYASFSFQSRRVGYDPVYSHERWEHRSDPNWTRQVATDYRYRRDHVDARPPRTWTADRNIAATGKAKDHTLAVAKPFSDLAKQKNNPVRFQPVAKDERQQIIHHGQEVRQARDERRTAESTPATAPAAKPGKRQVIQPSTGPITKTPIVSETNERLGRDQSPSSVRPVPRRQSNIEVIRGTTPADSPKREIKEKPVLAPAEQPVRREAAPVMQQTPVQRDAPRDSDQGETRKERKADRNKDDNQ